MTKISLYSKVYPHRRYTEEEVQDKDYLSVNDKCYDDGKELIHYDGHGVAFAILINEYDYMKESYLSGSEVRKGCGVKIFRNGKQVYEFFTRTYRQALLRVDEKISTLRSYYTHFPSHVGKDVWFKRGDKKIKCFAERFIEDQSCLILEHDEKLDYDECCDKFFKIDMVQSWMDVISIEGSQKREKIWWMLTDMDNGDWLIEKYPTTPDFDESTRRQIIGHTYGELEFTSLDMKNTEEDILPFLEKNKFRILDEKRSDKDV